MYPGYYTGIDGRRQFHYNDHVCPCSCCRCLCGPQPMANYNTGWYDTTEEYSKKQDHNSKKVFKKQVNNGAKTFGLLKFLRLSLAKSSISGINGIASSKSILAKIIWTLVFLGCLCGFGFQTFIFLQTYSTRPSIVHTDIENKGKAYFPAVTICNQNRIRKSAYCKYYNDDEECLDSTVNLTLSVQKINNAIYEAIASNNSEKKIEFGHNRTMVESCSFSGYPKMNETECKGTLLIRYDPNYGNCILLPAKNKDSILLEAHEADFWREENELSIFLNIQKEEYTEITRDPGLKISIHSEAAFADINGDGVMLFPGNTYYLGVQKTTIEYLPYPYKTNCTNFHQLPWQNKEKHMTSRMCTVGCSKYYQLKKCGIVVKTLSLFYDTLPWDNKTVTEAQVQCAKMEENATQSLCTSLCQIPCKHSVFEVQIGQAFLTKKDFEVNVHIDHDELGNMPHFELRHYYHELRSHYIYVKISFKNLEHKIFRHTSMYNTMELFSYLGGYSGVWLGFSLLTVYELAEIIFATFKFFLFKRKKKLKQKKAVRAVAESKLSLNSSSLFRKRQFDDER